MNIPLTTYASIYKNNTQYCNQGKIKKWLHAATQNCPTPELDSTVKIGITEHIAKQVQVKTQNCPTPELDSTTKHGIKENIEKWLYVKTHNCPTPELDSTVKMESHQDHSFHTK